MIETTAKKAKGTFSPFPFSAGRVMISAASAIASTA